MVFLPQNPFPFLSVGEFTYEEAQAHAAAADRFFGFEIEKIEAALAASGCRKRAPDSHHEEQQLWIGLAAKSLLTPYIEIRRTLERLALQTGSIVVDLGAAYGRMGFVIGRCYPQLQFLGIEYVGERVREAERCLQKAGIKNARMEHADLTSPGFRLPTADIYFIYDYGNEKAIEKTLFDLKRVARSRAITIVVRGKTCHASVEKRHRDWLQLRAEPENAGKSSIYSADLTLPNEIAL